MYFTNLSTSISRLQDNPSMNQTAGVNTVVIDHFAANLMRRDEQEEDLFAGEMLNGQDGQQNDQMDWTEDDPVSPIRAPEYQKADPNKVFESNFMARETQDLNPAQPPQKKPLTLHSAPKSYYQPEHNPSPTYAAPQQQTHQPEPRTLLPANYSPNIWSVGAPPVQNPVYQPAPPQRIYSEQPASNGRLEYTLPARSTQQPNQYTSVQYNSNNPVYQPSVQLNPISPYKPSAQPLQYTQTKPQHITTNPQPAVRLNNFAPLVAQTQQVTISSQPQPVYRPQGGQVIASQQYMSGNPVTLQAPQSTFTYQPAKTYY
jgi:hypothetical protein